MKYVPLNKGILPEMAIEKLVGPITRAANVEK